MLEIFCHSLKVKFFLNLTSRLCKFFLRCSNQKLTRQIINNFLIARRKFSIFDDTLSNRDIWTRFLEQLWQQLKYITLNLPLLYNYNEVLKQNIAWSSLNVPTHALRKTLKFFCNGREETLLPFSFSFKNYYIHRMIFNFSNPSDDQHIQRIIEIFSQNYQIYIANNFFLQDRQLSIFSTITNN